ncbi:phosphatase PAP2 family protein [Actinacidiphila rubida]|uniref:PAP2 superfamily protein n=1 Tax=Actinacidiphila rubida TaxID=310780 RepID=A0A1H8NSD8_9ACTN|nr:phosphatase PAP2 family protein [Actinacidiphila rubida]SEO32504.1 PAP2 superfamily protein [Actinacidiphila rubida]
MLWAAVSAVALVFLVTMEIAARHYGLPGPITTQAQEVVFAPKSGALLYASLGLMMVVLTWRQRFLALGAALGIDVVFLVVRLAVGAGPTFGNGALWVVLGCALHALVRLTGRDLTLRLKGVGLALVLVTGRKTGDAWLLITSKARPAVFDPYTEAADHALGNPSWLVGRLVRASGPVGTHLLDYVYIQLAVAAVAVTLYQLRNVSVERRFPRHHLVRTFLLIGLLGPGIYMLFPTVGPVFAYGADGGHWAVATFWPDTTPPLGALRPLPFDAITPRNCMPSLHTAWATAIFIHSRTGPRLLRYAGTFWLVATLGATLGFGYHYGVDLVAGAVFALTIEGGLRAHDRGWDRPGILLVAHGTGVFAVMLVSYRYLPGQMAAHPWLFGPLLLFATGSVIYDFVRTANQDDPLPGPQLRRRLQPELV